jgi:hypothetical protein
MHVTFLKVNLGAPAEALGDHPGWARLYTFRISRERVDGKSS